MPDSYKAQWCPYRLDFTFEARTSRGSMWHKDTYFIRLEAPDGRVAYAEAPLFRGLSAEDRPDFEQLLSEACLNPAYSLENPSCSSIAFAFESAFYSLGQSDRSPWSDGRKGIAINGLVWMGDKATMRRRIAEKLEQGFKVLKLKIGGIDFDDEVELLRRVRSSFGSDTLEIRLDANGSFTPENALDRLDQLSRFGIHSLEQPIKAGQADEMARICSKSPIAIGLDEELIGMRTFEEKRSLVEHIRPSYLILKPALCGGFRAADEYISLAGEGRWWATSALESNIGLYAIGKWLEQYNLRLPQGLGTGMLYSNNIASPLEMLDAALWYNPTKAWQSIENLAWRN